MATAPLSGGASSTPAGAQAPPAADFVTGDNTAGALAYLLLPAVYFLFLTDTYKQNRFVRFHSYQALFYCGGMFALIWVVWNQYCPGKVAPTDGKPLPLNVLWPV